LVDSYAKHNNERGRSINNVNIQNLKSHMYA